MTLAATLAHIVCAGGGGGGGGGDMIHDPTQPLVLGNQVAGNYCVMTWDAINHRVQIQSVYQPPGGAPLQSSTLTFGADGQLLVNNQTIAQLPELVALVASAQGFANAAAASASTASGFSSTAQGAASTAGAAAVVATEQATLSQQFAQAPPGTALPGGGDSSAVGAQRANQVAGESRDLDTSDLTAGDETFLSGFLFTEQQRNPAGQMIVTVPPGIYNSPEKRKRWASYQLRSLTGSIKFVPQSGGTNLLTPRVLAQGRTMNRYLNIGTGTRRTLVVPVAMPDVVDGEILMAFHALHQGPAQATTINFTQDGGPSLTWEELKAFPGNATQVSYPDYWVQRARIIGQSAASFELEFDEGTNVHFQACDWWILDDVDGVAPIFARDGRNTVRAQHAATLPAVAAQSLVLGSAALGAPSNLAQFSNKSTNMSTDQSGNTDGIADPAVDNTNTFKNEQWWVGHGTATADGDFVATVNWSSGQYRGELILAAYGPKTVPGAGVVQLNCEGGRDELTVPYGSAELWFHPDGINVDLKTPKP